MDEYLLSNIKNELFLSDIKKKLDKIERKIDNAIYFVIFIFGCIIIIYAQFIFESNI
jgi:hypothetical protein